MDNTSPAVRTGAFFVRSTSPWTERMWSITRIVVGSMFLTAGTMKLFGVPVSPAARAITPLMSQIGVAGLLEVVGGALIMLGLFTRPVAFILAGEMAVAYFQVHHPRSFFPTVNSGVSAVLYCFIFLYMSLAGAGPWSLDALIARRPRDP